MNFEEKEFAKILEKIECNPTDANAYHELGNFLGVIYDELALVALTKCIELEPTNPDAYSDRAFCYRDLTHYNQAISDLNKAIELSPNNGKFYKFRGIFLEEDENFSAAVKDFSKLIELNFENVAEWYAKRGENFFELREFEKALADYEKAVELNYYSADEKSESFDEGSSRYG